MPNLRNNENNNNKKTNFTAQGTIKNKNKLSSKLEERKLQRSD